MKNISYAFSHAFPLANGNTLFHKMLLSMRSYIRKYGACLLNSITAGGLHLFPFV